MIAPMVGDRVRISGLQLAPHHNGSVGKVVKRVAEPVERLGVETELEPKGLLVRPENLELYAVGEPHLDLYENVLARQILCPGYMTPSVDTQDFLGRHDEHTRAMLEAHGGALPLSYLATYSRLRRLLGGHGDSSPPARFTALQSAVRDAGPTVTLCGRLDDCVRFAGHIPLPPSQPVGHGTFEALILPCTGGARKVKLPRRVDYLHVIAERLGESGPLAMHPPKGYKGIEMQQPVLYHLLPVADAAGAQMNALASSLRGFTVHGDALLLEAKLPPGGILECADVGPDALEKLLAKHDGGLQSYVLATFGRSLLGSREALPRIEAWPATTPPTGIFKQWLQQQGAPLDSSGNKCELECKARAHQVDAQGKDVPGTYYLATATCGDDRVEGPLCPSKKEAERMATLELMRVVAAKDPPPPPFVIVDIADDSVSQTAGEVSPLSAGDSLEVSYSLLLLSSPDEPAAADLLEAAELRSAIGDGKTTRGLLLGANVLHSEVEDVLAEMGAEWLARAAAYSGPATSAASGGGAGGGVLPLSRTVELRAKYRWMQGARFALQLTVHSVTKANESEWEMARVVGEGPSLGEQRMSKLHSILVGLSPTSVCDVGCGNGSLFTSLLERQQRGATIPSLESLVGVDVDQPPCLRSATKKLTTKLTALASEDGAAASPLPQVRLLKGSLAALGSTPPALLHGGATVGANAAFDVITFVEVVEHLDPPVLAAVGPALLGECKPRALVVTTPNKEYNFFNMTACSNPDKGQPACGRDDPGLTQPIVKERKFCKNCCKYFSDVEPRLDEYLLRNDDHRFEWTRAEFKQWAEDLGQRFGYSVRFDGVGGGAWTEEPPAEAPRYHGFRGPSTQIAIFERLVGQEPHVGTEDGAAAASATSGGEQEQPLESFWSSVG